MLASFRGRATFLDRTQFTSWMEGRYFEVVILGHGEAFDKNWLFRDALLLASYCSIENTSSASLNLELP